MHDYIEETIRQDVSGELSGARAPVAAQATRADPSPASMDCAVVTATVLVGGGRDEACSALV